MMEEQRRKSPRVLLKRLDAADILAATTTLVGGGENAAVHKRPAGETETRSHVIVPKRLKLSNYCSRSGTTTQRPDTMKVDVVAAVEGTVTRLRRTDVEDWTQNHLILKNVFKNMDVDDLKNCRSVCKMWATVAGSTLAPQTAVTDIQKGTTRIALNFPGCDPVKLISSSREKCRGIPLKTLMLNQDVAEGMGYQNFIKIKHLEVTTDRQEWSRPELSKTLEFFKTPMVQNLESLRISGFRVDVMQNLILPYFLPKYMNKLKSLKLFGPFTFSRASLYLPEDNPPKADVQLEELTIHFLGVSRFSWAFLENCPNLKKLSVNGREPSRYKNSFRLRNDFGLCFLDLPKYVHHTSIRSVSLACDMGLLAVENAQDFMKKFIVEDRLNLDHVTYKFGGCYHLVPSFLQGLPPPAKSAKVIVDAIDFGEPFNFMYTSTQLPSLLNLLESKKYSRLRTMEFRLRVKPVNGPQVVSDFFTLVRMNTRVILHLPPQKFLRRYIDVWGYFHSTFLSWFPFAQQLCNITNNGLKKRTVLNIQHSNYATITQEITSGAAYGDVRWIQRPLDLSNASTLRTSEFDVLLNGQSNRMKFEHLTEIDFEKTFFFVRLDTNPFAVPDFSPSHISGTGARTTRQI